MVHHLLHFYIEQKKKKFMNDSSFIFKNIIILKKHMSYILIAHILYCNNTYLISRGSMIKVRINYISKYNIKY